MTSRAGRRASEEPSYAAEEGGAQTHDRLRAPEPVPKELRPSLRSPAGDAAAEARPRTLARPSLGRVVWAVSAATFVFLIVLAGTFWMRQRLNASLRSQVLAVLDASLESAVVGVHSWAQSGLRAVNVVASDPHLGRLLGACPTDDACPRVQAFLERYLSVSGLSGAVLFNAHREPVARTGRALAQATEGPTAQELTRLESEVRPLGVAFGARGEAHLRLGAVILGEGDARVGYVVGYWPADRLASLMRAGRVGRSGETYVFDGQGRVLSQSRFRAKEQRAGRVLHLRLPGGGASLATLTHDAAAVLAGEDGHDLEGYLDYRGVEVVGAYRGLEELGLGVASKVDESDAYRVSYTLGRGLTALAALVLLSLGVAGVLLWRSQGLRRRVNSAERRARRFGQYVLEEKLGEGGMGTVYLARHALLKRKAAVKLLRADRTTPEALSRFEREVQVTATLSHPNTVSIYDYGHAGDGAFYYAMEYVEGLDLQRLVNLFGPLDQARVLAILRQVCGSLGEAHSQGLVHRDIKPGNLMLCSRGGVADTVKVLDFGIVQVGPPGSSEEPMLGTPEYMAPELFHAGAVASPQSDFYALGAVAYCLLCGSPPFSGADTFGIGRMQLTEAPVPLADLLDERPDPALEAAIMTCLRKSAGARPSTAAAVVRMLDRSALAHEYSPAEAEAWWAARAQAVTQSRLSRSEPVERRRLLLPTRPTTGGSV